MEIKLLEIVRGLLRQKRVRGRRKTNLLLEARVNIDKAIEALSDLNG